MDTPSSTFSTEVRGYPQFKGRFMLDVSQSDEAARGKQASGHLQVVLMTTDHFDEVLAGYSRVGKSSDDGHNFVYTAVDRWENEFFKFFDQQLQ